MIAATVISALAATRATRAWLYETVGEPFRNQVDDWCQPDLMPDGSGGLVPVDTDRCLAIKGAVAELNSCPHCIGFWFTVAAVLAYRTRLRPIVVAFAGAAILSAIVDRYPGFDPEPE